MSEARESRCLDTPFLWFREDGPILPHCRPTLPAYKSGVLQSPWMSAMDVASQAFRRLKLPRNRSWEGPLPGERSFFGPTTRASLALRRAVAFPSALKLASAALIRS